MLSVKISWTNLKALSLSLSYADTNGNYYIFASTASVNYDCIIAKNGGTDQTDFETNYKASATSLL